MSYREGQPCWVDVASADVGRAAAFYTAFFGWEAEEAPGGGGYTMFRLGGRYAAAAGPSLEAMPSVWQVYLWTEDADACAQRVREAGGAVVTEPFDVLDAGRMAVLRDPTGAHFSVWQAREHGGAEARGEPGALDWNECQTPDPDAAEEFYVRVFDFGVERPDGLGGYRVFTAGGERVAGLVRITPEWGEVPPNWSTVFRVEDADAAVARARALGGGLLNGPHDIPVGRFAVLHDPAGAVFQVIQ